jgi:hypothetical protein
MSDVINEGSQAFNIAGLNTPTGYLNQRPNAEIWNTEEQQALGGATLPPGATQTATLINNSPDQELHTDLLHGNIAASTTSAGQSQQVQTPNAGPANTYDATKVGYENAAQANSQHLDANQVQATQAAQGQVDPNQLIETNFERLSKTDTNHNGIPDFSEAALRQADEQMNARGLGASSINTQARTFAIMNSMIPMAQFDAQQYSQMAMLNLNNQQQANMQTAAQRFQAQIANLSNDQQTALQNAFNKQQVLLTDQAMDNASKQFNAQSENQVAQFQASLMGQIMTANAARADAMNQYNAGQANAQAQFNANLENQRQQFNVTNQLAIDQSNVAWRRQINTANTAAINAANQVNAQNMFNLTTTAQANLWQQWRDEAQWANTSSENDKTRATNLAVAAIQRDSYFQGLAKEEENKLYEGLGTFALRLVGL